MVQQARPKENRLTDVGRGGKTEGGAAEVTRECAPQKEKAVVE
ncbi:hypothetical protein [Cupriavidus sp. D39]|nr:hypothetical protein [Cupriavidus sp. D39]MCY0856284.1 hypothetical protein [Cupriavidus sp. D39]